MFLEVKCFNIAGNCVLPLVATFLYHLPFIIILIVMLVIANLLVRKPSIMQESIKQPRGEKEPNCTKDTNCAGENEGDFK